MTKTLNLPILNAADLLEGKAQFALPKMVPIRQKFDRPQLNDIEQAVKDSCNQQNLAAKIKPGMDIALAVGSRGISGQLAVIKALIAYLQALGARPAIIPAMGSHGGPSARGQKELLAGYGISEQSLGIKIISSLDVKPIAKTAQGLDAYFSTDALAFDGVIVINRIKPHTDFTAAIESGLTKMCAVGLGKHRGASYIHDLGFAALGDTIRQVGEVLLTKANILGGLAIIENAYKEVALVEYVPCAQILQREVELLNYARKLMPSLPFSKVDFLLVQRIGKDISGAMFDPNITGRRKIWGVADLAKPRIATMATLELTAATHGNAAGLAVADFCSTRLLQGMDFAATYSSLITCGIPQHAHIPIFFERDDDIIRAAAKSVSAAYPEQVSMAWILDTAHIDKLWVSTNMLDKLDQGRSEPAGEAIDWPFNEHGLLAWTDF